MNIHKKIEEIRSMPQHMRMRYVWISVGACMFFIVVIWLFSIKALFQQKNSGEGMFQLKKQVEEATKKTPSISEFMPSEAALNQLGDDLSQKMNK